MKEKKSILITGAHRSGSTWVGKIVSASPKIRYVHEPFNPERPNPRPPFKLWFKFIHKGTPSAEQTVVQDYLMAFQSLSWKDLKATMHRNSFVRNLKEWRSRRIRRSLFKDPIALLSSPWFHETLDFNVVVLIRHPAAFVASLKVKDWQFNFDNFLNQKELMEGPFKDFREEIERITHHRADIIDQGILLWNCFYSLVMDYQTKYQDQWYFSTHEKLSESPTHEFKKMFAFLNITWSKEVEEEIARTTQANATDSIHKRDSKANIKTWKTRLTGEEIAKIKIGTEEVWANFYSEADW